MSTAYKKIRAFIHRQWKQTVTTVHKWRSYNIWLTFQSHRSRPRCVPRSGRSASASSHKAFSQTTRLTNRKHKHKLTREHYRYVTSLYSTGIRCPVSISHHWFLASRRVELTLTIQLVYVSLLRYLKLNDRINKRSSRLDAFHWG